MAFLVLNVIHPVDLDLRHNRGLLGSNLLLGALPWLAQVFSGHPCPEGFCSALFHNSVAKGNVELRLILLHPLSKCRLTHMPQHVWFIPYFQS